MAEEGNGIKGRRKPPPPVVPVAVNEESMESLVQEVVLALKSGSTGKDERRNLVLKLVGQSCTPRDIFKLLAPRFGVSYGMIKKDIAWARDYYVNWATKRTRNEMIGEVLGSALEIKRLAVAKGDLNAATQSNRHAGELLKLTKDEASAGAVLGVVIINSKEEPDKWQTQATEAQQSQPSRETKK